MWRVVKGSRGGKSIWSFQDDKGSVCAFGKQTKLAAETAQNRQNNLMSSVDWQGNGKEDARLWKKDEERQRRMTKEEDRRIEDNGGGGGKQGAAPARGKMGTHRGSSSSGKEEILRKR